MIDENDYLTPPKRLAIAYSASSQRALLTLILEFDARLAQIVARDGEAVIAQMRMAWWRDVIGKEADQRPAGEPMVAQLNQLEPAQQQRAADAMLHIVDGWDLLLAHEEWNDDILTSHARSRGQGIFGESDDYQAAAQKWALQDLANQMGRDLQPAHLWDDDIRRPRPRHLSILSMAADQQYCGAGPLSALRLFAHGLTGL